MSKNKVNPTSIRIPEKTLERIDRLCDDNNCSRNDFITSILDEAVNNEVNEPKEQAPNYKAVIDLSAETKPKLTLGTIKTMSDGNKYRLTNIQDNGVQIWQEIEEIPEFKNVRAV